DLGAPPLGVRADHEERPSIPLLERPPAALRHVRAFPNGVARGLPARPASPRSREPVHRNVPRDLARLRRPVAACLEAPACAARDGREEGGGRAGHPAIPIRPAPLHGGVRRVLLLGRMERCPVPAARALLRAARLAESQLRGSPCSLTVTVRPGGAVTCMRCSLPRKS